jgi:hypothetical protein
LGKVKAVKLNRKAAKSLARLKKIHVLILPVF